MEEEPDVGLGGEGRLPDVLWGHQQVVSMDPNLLEGGEQLLQVGNLLGKTLINHNVVTPEFVELDMGQMSQVCLIQGLEVVEEGLHDILVKVVEG